MANFLKSVKEEMRIVTWPTKKQLRKDVSTVLQTTVLYAIFFGVSDYVIASVIKLFMK
ncbi:preprotein translocase subunit SecE [Vagococcus humatus]|uniref:Protein translocase subunit SecE n=1 Tax=Vagococcus humatus TaxID=1889241 RepID=A0A3R9YJ79_9ENTE|nr:preprotein translocase subunit SecE [Vagococcus humatus]RST88991.1 preprotein translocase subunit SecE [Vagococcus humatus]